MCSLLSQFGPLWKVYIYYGTVPWWLDDSSPDSLLSHPGLRFCIFWGLYSNPAQAAGKFPSSEKWQHFVALSPFCCMALAVSVWSYGFPREAGSSCALKNMLFPAIIQGILVCWDRQSECSRALATKNVGMICRAGSTAESVIQGFPLIFWVSFFSGHIDDA